MAPPNKSRNNRRPSSTSYTSTITTLVFIALCVLGVWMLTSNSVVAPNTRTAVENSVTTNDISEDKSETTAAITTTTITNNNNNNKKDNSNNNDNSNENNPGDSTSETTTNTNNNKNSDDSIETTTTNNNDKNENNSGDSTSETTATTNNNKNSDDSTETTTTDNNNNNNDKNENNSIDSTSKTTTTSTSNNNNSDDSTETTTTSNNNSDDSTETTMNASEESSETNTKSQEQKTTPIYGDNPGNLPEDAIKNDVASTNNDQKNSVSEKEVKSTNNKEEENNVEQDENTKAMVEQNKESNNGNGDDNGEQTTSDQKDVQGSKNNEDEEKKKKSKEETKEQEESEEKQEKNRRKSSKESKKTWSTQAEESRGEKERQKSESSEAVQDVNWSLCNVTAGADYIPCLDNEKYLRTSHRKHYEHRERHCPEDAPTCLVPLPKGYKSPVQWPNSRDKIWYHNVPHTKLAEVKGHQNWVKLMGEFLTFPGGGTQFIHGALHYIDFLQKAEPGIAWGKHTRVILDVGCGVGSFGGYLFERDAIAMSFAPKDEHEAQVQFALERGIPAISAVMGTQRLQFPSRVFDLVHCARCRVPWHEDGGLLLLELNRVLRPGGYFVWSATPVYQTLEEDVEIWKHMTSLTKAMCWDLVNIKNDTLNQVGAAFYRKPTSNECYELREKSQPPICKDDDDPNAAWYVPLQACMHKLPADKADRGAKWPEAWPNRLQKAPYWLNNAQSGKPSSKEFAADTERFKIVVDELSSMGVSWSSVRNIMDMRAIYGGFAAALKDLPVWVFNVVNVDSADTLPIIFERGLIGIYHDWCESFSTYPRTYDLLHADHLFSILKTRCQLVPVMAEVDRILRPGGHLIIRDESSVINEVENLLKSIHWEITSKNQEGLCAKKSNWRPNTYVNLY